MKKKKKKKNDSRRVEELEFVVELDFSQRSCDAGFCADGACSAR